MNSEKLSIFTIQSLKKIFNPVCEIGNDFILLDSFEQLADSVFRYPCKVNAYTGAYLTSGKAKLSVNLEEIEVKEGMMMMIDPGKFVQIINTENIEGKAFLISEAFFHEMQLDIKSILPFYIDFISQSYLILEEEDKKLLEQYFLMFEMVAKSQKEKFYKETLSKIGSALAFSLGSILNKQRDCLRKEMSDKTRGEKIYINFISLIGKFHKQERSVGFYADKLSITPKYLTSLIKKVSGKSAAQWIDEFVIMEAKNMIKYSDMSIQEISYELNFPNQSFFGKFFKHHTGISPGNYRKKGDSSYVI